MPFVPSTSAGNFLGYHRIGGLKLPRHKLSRLESVKSGVRAVKRSSSIQGTLCNIFFFHVSRFTIVEREIIYFFTMAFLDLFNS